MQRMMTITITTGDFKMIINYIFFIANLNILNTHTIMILLYNKIIIAFSSYIFCKYIFIL
jgi:hypothetical protein